MKYDYQPFINEIQRKILAQLISKESLRFSELKPTDIESDLFNYHLKTLLENGFIVKKESSYSLSENGKRLISNFSIYGNPESLFRVSVVLVAINTSTNSVLLQKRARIPFLNDISQISGKVRIGELIEDAAKRKLMEEANLSADFKYIGTIRKIKRNSENKILEDVFYNYCICFNPTGTLITNNDFGTNFWSSFDEAIEFQKNNKDHGNFDEQILEQLNAKNYNNFFYQQETVVMEY